MQYGNLDEKKHTRAYARHLRLQTTKRRLNKSIMPECFTDAILPSLSFSTFVRFNKKEDGERFFEEFLLN